MERIYITDQAFSNINFTEKPLAIGDYENCQFSNCQFQNTSLSGINFSGCVFSGCDMGMAKLSNTTFNDIQFINCKLLGLHFNDCNTFLFTVSFEHCILNLASFYKMKMKKTRFTGSTLQEADFTETDLSAAVFGHCNLAGAIFEQTILEKADFRTADGFSINPERNRMKKARFAVTGLSGLLHKYNLDID